MFLEILVRLLITYFTSLSTRFLLSSLPPLYPVVMSVSSTAVYTESHFVLLKQNVLPGCYIVVCKEFYVIIYFE